MYTFKDIILQCDVQHDVHNVNHSDIINIVRLCNWC